MQHRKRYFVYVALFLLIVINYIDRVVLAVSAKPLSAELGISPVAMGYLFSSYIWTYLLCLIPMGMLTDRFGPRWVSAIGLSVWSVATALTGLVSGYSAVLASRLVMGAAEASSYPPPAVASFAIGHPVTNAALHRRCSTAEDTPAQPSARCS